MKLPVLCNQCTKTISDVAELNKHSRFVHVTDSMVYKLECTRGHIEFHVLRHFPHEILFEIGAQAIEDGYFREAISSFSSSLERFYEFFMRVTCEVEGVDTEEFNKTWKIISSSSERQLGAYSFRYLAYFGKVPAVMSGKWKELRNNVIHKGYIPSKDEATIYGEKVLNEIMSVLLELSGCNPHTLSSYCNKFLSAVYEGVVSENPKYQVSQVDNPFILNWNRLHFESVGKSIDLVKRLEQRPKCYSAVNY